MQRMPKRPRRNERFWANAYIAMDRFPTAFPTEIVVGFIPAVYGSGWAVCDKIGQRFYIWIREPEIELPPLLAGTMSVREMFLWDAFLHEYAHLLDWSHLTDRHDAPYVQRHGATWGVWYARLYQSLTDDP